MNPGDKKWINRLVRDARIELGVQHYGNSAKCCKTGWMKCRCDLAKAIRKLTSVEEFLDPEAMRQHKKKKMLQAVHP